MDRSYIEYSRIVESFITRSDESINHSGDVNDLSDSNQSINQSIDQRMKLAFINVLREEMTE